MNPTLPSNTHNIPFLLHWEWLIFNKETLERISLARTWPQQRSFQEKSDYPANLNAFSATGWTSPKGATPSTCSQLKAGWGIHWIKEKQGNSPLWNAPPLNNWDQFWSQSYTPVTLQIPVVLPTGYPVTSLLSLHHPTGQDLSTASPLRLEKPSKTKSNPSSSTATATTNPCPQVVTKDNRNTLEPWQEMPGQY